MKILKTDNNAKDITQHFKRENLIKNAIFFLLVFISAPSYAMQPDNTLVSSTEEEKSKVPVTLKKGNKKSLDYHEARGLLASKDKNDKESARSALYSLALSTEWSNLLAAELLFKSDCEDDKVAGRKALHSITLNEAGRSSLAKAGELLFKSDSEGDKVVGRKALHSVAQNKVVSIYSAIVSNLLFQSMEISDKEIGRKVLYDVVAHPEKYYTCPNLEGVYEDQLLLQLKTANTLIKTGDEQDKKIAMDAINHTYYKACEFLGSRFGERSQRILGLMGSDLNPNPLQLKALQTLVCQGDESSKERAVPGLLDLAKKGQYEAATSIPTKYKAAYEEGMKYIAQMVGHAKRYEAAKVLYDLGGKYSDEGKKALTEISLQENHPNQKEAKEALATFCVIM